MNLSALSGNEEVKRSLSAAFASGRFPHAILLQGENGCGKKTLAKLLANALVCRDREHAPCGTCPSCIRAAAGSHPDIRIVEGTGVTRSVSVDTVREISADAYRMPEEAAVSVYVLLLGERMLEPAQNKLLKLIEEPPENTVFLLVCRSADQLLPTIRSRVQSYTLRPLSLQEAADWLEQREGTDPQRARELAELCGGNPGRMLEELSGGGSAAALSLAREIASAAAEGNAHGLLESTAPLIRDRKLCGEVLERLQMIFRDALVLRLGGTAVLSGAPQEAAKLCGLRKKRLTVLTELMDEFRDKVGRNANMTLLITDLCAGIRETAER